MIRDVLLVCVIVFGLLVLVGNIYTAGLETHIAVLEERQQMRQDSIAYYAYEYKHSTSGTRRHVGKALQKVINRLSVNEQRYAIRQKELQELKDRRQQFAELLW